MRYRSLLRRTSQLTAHFHFSPVRHIMTYPKTAYAITIAKTGDVDVLDKTEVPVDVKPDHVVVKVRRSFFLLLYCSPFWHRRKR
jgi:hypothetical protein